MLVNLFLVLGTLAIIGSWVVAVAIVRSDRFADRRTSQRPAVDGAREDVLAY